jgi:hypothetical protein
MIADMSDLGDFAVTKNAGHEKPSSEQALIHR